jgi:hypothetical protein
MIETIEIECLIKHPMVPASAFVQSIMIRSNDRSNFKQIQCSIEQY